MEKKTIKVTVNKTEYIFDVELVFDDEKKVPVIDKQQIGTWKYESKMRMRQGRK